MAGIPGTVMTLKIAVLDVGHGDCAVVYNDDGSSVMVIDCGNGPALIEFLKAEGLNHIDIALVTHNDSDHVNGMRQVLDSIPVALLAIHPNIKDPDGVPKRVMSGLIDAIDPELTELDLVTTNNQRLLDGLRSLGFQAELIYPNPRQAVQASRSNTTSAVLRVEWKGKVAIFSGDLDKEGWNRLISDDPSVTSKLRSDILKFPHHGGRLVSPRNRIGSSEYTLSLLRCLKPNISIISTANHKRWQHPDLSVLEGLRTYAREAEHRLLCTQVTSVCDSNYASKRDAVIAVLPHSHLSICGRSGYPCAGTVRLQVTANGDITIESDSEYRQIVQNFVDRQCQ